jgi:hypothetical protein
LKNSTFYINYENYKDNIGSLAEYGFIREEDMDSIEDIFEKYRVLEDKFSKRYRNIVTVGCLTQIFASNEYRALEKEWNDLSTEYIVPNLPNPLASENS